jgi:hypothetical protein
MAITRKKYSQWVYVVNNTCILLRNCYQLCLLCNAVTWHLSCCTVPVCLLRVCWWPCSSELWSPVTWLFSLVGRDRLRNMRVHVLGDRFQSYRLSIVPERRWTKNKKYTYNEVAAKMIYIKRNVLTVSKFHSIQWAVETYEQKERRLHQVYYSICYLI